MNLLGPLVNPAAAQYQIIGVFDEAYCEPMAQAAHMLGIKRVMVVYGTDGQDEISVCAPSRIVMMEEDGTMTTSTFDPKELGIASHPLEELIGGDGQENGKLAKEILEGKGRTAIRDAVAVNGGAALTVYGLSESIREGTEMVMKALSDGSVKRQLEAVVASSARIAMEEERGDVA
jgi:anthranilate synthase/phosphoribosyltransferase